MKGGSMKDKRSYDDIMDFPRPVSLMRIRMPRQERAAQFASFAALKGYEDEIAETARLTDNRAELTDDEKDELDKRLTLLRDSLHQRPEISVTYFIPDHTKSGGCYNTVTGEVRWIDDEEMSVVFTDGRRIRLADISFLDGEIFRGNCAYPSFF